MNGCAICLQFRSTGDGLQRQVHVMKVILSRKGFDSSAGGKPSPILKNGQIFSIPIPTNDKNSPHRYSDVVVNDINAADMLSLVGAKKLHMDTTCHFDPILKFNFGLFGQAGNAQRELDNLGVREGDLFLFFGWFRDFYSGQNADYHHIFGWLQIDQVIRGSEQIREFCAISGIAHPHACADETRFKYNTLFVSHPKSKLKFLDLDIEGHGLFPRTSNKLILTEQGRTRSNWYMPKKYFSPSRNPDLFETRLRWSTQKSNRIKCVGYGQEFVMNTIKNPSVKDWARDLFLSSKVVNITDDS